MPNNTSHPQNTAPAKVSGPTIADAAGKNDVAAGPKIPKSPIASVGGDNPQAASDSRVAGNTHSSKGKRHSNRTSTEAESMPDVVGARNGPGKHKDASGIPKPPVPVDLSDPEAVLKYTTELHQRNWKAAADWMYGEKQSGAKYKKS